MVLTHRFELWPVYSMYTVLRMTKISNSIVTEIIINWLYFSIVIFSYTKSTLRYLVWRIWDSNSWPIECKSIALTTELIPHIENDCSWDLPTVLWWVFQHTKTFLRAIRLSISYLDKRYANSSMTATGTFAQPCYKFETPHILLMNYKINVRL